MKTLALVIGGVLLFGKKGSASPTGVLRPGEYATPPVTRPGSTAGRSQASSGGPSKSSSGGGGGAPGTQATGQNFWASLENLFSPNRIDTSTSPDPSVPDFWANPTPEGTSDVFAPLFPPVDPNSEIPQFDNPNGFQFDDSGQVINPDTGVPFGQSSGDVSTPGGFFPDQFGPEIPPDPSTSFDDGSGGDF